MDDSQSEHVGMFVKVKTFLNKKASELAATPVIASTLQPAFIAKIDEILEEEEDASAPITGSTELKRDLRKEVEDKGFEVAAACAAYYTIVSPNPVLRVKCEFQRSDLQTFNTRDNDLYVDMKRVHSIADPIKTLLVDFGVLDTDVDELGTAVAAYFLQLEAPFDARDERAASGEQVDRLFKEAMELLTEKIDVVMKFYVTNNPELHGYYLRSRAIDNTGGGPIPDEDEEILIGAGQYHNADVPVQMDDNTRIVIINRTSNVSMVQFGFNSAPDAFGAIKTDIPPDTTTDEIALDLGFTTGIPYAVFYNPGNPTAASITIRVKLYY